MDDERTLVAFGYLCLPFERFNLQRERRFGQLVDACLAHGQHPAVGTLFFQPLPGGFGHGGFQAPGVDAC